MRTENKTAKIQDKQQGPIVQYRELYSITCDKTSWKRILKKECPYIYMYIYITDIYMYNRDWYNIVNQLCFKKIKLKQPE